MARRRKPAAQIKIDTKPKGTAAKRRAQLQSYIRALRDTFDEIAEHNGGHLPNQLAVLMATFAPLETEYL